MSVRVMTMVYGARLGSAYRKAVMLKLADVADEDGGSIRLSVARIVRETEISERTVQYTLSAFEDEGLLKTEVAGGRGPGSTAHRRLNLDALAGLPRTMGATHAPTPVARVQPTTEKGATGAPNPSVIRQGLTQKRSPIARTDGAGGDHVPITPEIVREAEQLGCDLPAIVERYRQQAAKKRIRDPAAYILRAIHDDAAKRMGVPVATLQGPARRQPRQTAVAARDALTEALSRYGANVLRGRR